MATDKEIKFLAREMERYTDAEKRKLFRNVDIIWARIRTMALDRHTTIENCIIPACNEYLGKV
jgi:hypothetical protein